MVVGEEKMAEETKEIRRAQWAQFFRKFSRENHYRQIHICYKDSEGQKEIQLDDHPFIGLALAKNGRLISGIQFYAGRGDASNVAEPVLTVQNPERVVLEKDDNGHDRRIYITTKDLNEVNAYIGDRDDRLARHLVEKVAYSLYVKRGGSHGADGDDWREAEKKVRETEELFA